MNLVERYIEAVKFWLPKHLKDDVAAELADDIRSEIEEAEREKGRKLTDDEIAAILKARGRPMIVASRYLPKRWLIGPELFPIYILVLKIVAFACLIPVAVSIAISLAAQHELGGIIAGTWGQLWNNVLSAFAVVTIIFAVIERQGVRPDTMDNWNPKTLRPIVDASRIPRGESVGDIAGNLILIMLFAAGYLSHNVYTFGNGQFTLSPEWVPFCQISILIAVVEIALAATNLFRPYWTAARILARTAVDLAKTAAFAWVLGTNLLREIAADGLPRESADTLLNVSRSWMEHAHEIAAVVAFIILARAVWRLFHLRPTRTAVVA